MKRDRKKGGKQMKEKKKKKGIECVRKIKWRVEKRWSKEKKEGSKERR